MWTSVFAVGFASAEPAVPGGPDSVRLAEPLELSLAGAIELALTNNRDLVNAQLSRAVQRMSLRVAERQFRPDGSIAPYTDYHILGPEDAEYTASGVALGVNMRIPTGGRFDVLLNNMVDRRNGDAYGSVMTIGFTQPLLKGGGVAVNMASLKNARNAEKSNVLALRSAITSTINAVIRSYRGFVQSQRGLEISEGSLQRAQAQREVNKLLIESGRMAEQDLVQNETSVAGRELSLTEARNRLDAARLSLIEVLDIESHVSLELTDALTVEPLALSRLDIARALAVALANRPDYLQALLRLDNAETELMLAKNNRLWDLTASIDVNVAEFGDTYRVARLAQGDYRIGLDFTIPLGDLSRQQRYVSAETSLLRARNDLVELEQAVDIAVRNGVREVEVRYRQVGLAQRALELSERQFEVEKEKLNRGLTTNFQVSSFEEALVNARNGEVAAVIAYLNALTSLDATLGVTLDAWGVDIRRLGG